MLLLLLKLPNKVMLNVLFFLLQYKENNWLNQSKAKFVGFTYFKLRAGSKYQKKISKKLDPERYKLWSTLSSRTLNFDPIQIQTCGSMFSTDPSILIHIKLYIGSLSLSESL